MADVNEWIERICCCKSVIGDDDNFEDDNGVMDG